MDIPEYFSNVVLAQFKATGIPLKVYVNGEYLIITDMYEISDPLIGSGMDEDGNMNQFDYREIDHLLVGGNVIDLATYTKAMAGDTPEQDAKKDEEPKEESIQELTKKEQDLELKSLKLKMDAAKEAMAAAKDKMNQVKKQPTEENALKSESITEAGVDRPEEKKTAILNAIAKEEKRSEFQNRILNQIKRAIVDGEPLFKLPFKTQADYRRLMKMYKIPFSSKRAEKGNLRAESIKKGSYVTNKDGLVGRVDNISGDKEIADIRYNDGKEESLPIKNLKIFEASLGHAEVRKLEKSLSSKNKEALSKAIKDKTIKTSKDLINWLNSISESVNENHDYTFGIGDIVKNKNTSCPHHGSMGIVQKIMKLANDMGMVVKYRVVNSGPTYNPGDSLVKTMDQLEPVQNPAETEAPMDENK